MEHSLFYCGCESKLISSWSKTLVPSYWKFQSILYTELFIAQASFVISPVIYLSFQVVLFPFFPLNFFLSFSPSLPLHPHLTSPAATSWREALKQILMSISKCRMQSWSFSLSSCLGNSSVNFLKLFNSRCSPEALQHEVISHEQNPDILLMLQMIKPLLAQRAGIFIDTVKTDLCLCNRRRCTISLLLQVPKKTGKTLLWCLPLLS